MHAGAQDLVGLADVRIGELGEGKFGLHGITGSGSYAHHPAAIENLFGVEARLDALAQRGNAGLLRMENVDRRADLIGAAQQHGVTANRFEALTQQRGMSIGRRQRRPDQSAAQS
jgi:hypothetical protein